VVDAFMEHQIPLWNFDGTIKEYKTIKDSRYDRRDVEIDGKKFKGIILNKENREPNESDMTNALNFSVARFKEWYKDEQDKAIKMKKQANKEYHFTDMARKLTIEDEIAEREK
jgi:hypothetical protein